MFADTVDSLVNLSRPDNCNVKFGRGVGWAPARRHVDICEQAMKWDADYILILGADQVYEPDLLCQLVSHIENGYEVICAMVPTRGFVSWQDMQPFQPMAWRFKAGNIEEMRHYNGMDVDGDLIETLEPDTGIQECNFIGSGVLMFQKDHLLAMKKPWFFETIVLENFSRRASMDCTFVWRLQLEAYAKVWVDTSIRVKHLHVFQIDESYQERFADWKHAEGNPDTSICRYTGSDDALVEKF
jgi:hypothetical protein